MLKNLTVPGVVTAAEMAPNDLLFTSRLPECRVHKIRALVAYKRACISASNLAIASKIEDK